MMNNIEILEEFIEKNIKSRLRTELNANELQAIENLIKEYKELKEKYEFVINNNLDDKYEEVLEKTFKKYIDKDFISKSKVKEKIEELDSIYQQEIKQKYNGRYYHQLSYAIQILKELEGDDK